MKTMKKLNINVNENNQLVINKMVIDQINKIENFTDRFNKDENYKYYYMNIKGYSKCVKFWNQLLQQVDVKTNFGGDLYDPFSYITIVTEDYEITFNCPKNYYLNIYLIIIDLKIK